MYTEVEPAAPYSLERELLPLTLYRVVAGLHVVTLDPSAARDSCRILRKPRVSVIHVLPHGVPLAEEARSAKEDETGGLHAGTIHIYQHPDYVVPETADGSDDGEE